MNDSVYREGMDLPKEFQPAPGIEGLYYLGALHGKGWIARSYFVERETGNVLVSPLVYSESLGDFIDARGGLAYIFVTHEDEINPAVLSEVGREGPGKPPAQLPACEYKKRFECKIATHAMDTFDLGKCGIDLSWDADFCPDPDLQFIHTPGHTPGCASLLLDSEAGRLLFCGDLLALNDSGKIETEVEERELSYLPSTLNSWSKVIEHNFDALIPLHTTAGSPVPFIAYDGRSVLKIALAEVTAWWEQIRSSQ